MTESAALPRHLGRSSIAIFAGFAAIMLLSLATDQLLHVLKVYPPWGKPMDEPGLLMLALSYRLVYGVLGSYIAAHLAPRHPMRHAMILGTIGLVLSTAGAIVTIPMELSPAWYPVVLVLTALPCAWLGGLLHRQHNAV